MDKLLGTEIISTRVGCELFPLEALKNKLSEIKENTDNGKELKLNARHDNRERYIEQSRGDK